MLGSRQPSSESEVVPKAKRGGGEMTKADSNRKAGSGRTRTPLMVLLLTIALGTGCSYKAGYNVTYLPKPPVTEQHEGKVLIYMAQEDEQWVYSGNPTSLTGGATTLTLPLGNITKQVAERVFREHFSQAHSSVTMDDAGLYLVAVQPSVQKFEYAYNSLQNLGFAITPEVWLDLHVRALDSQGAEILRRTYQSGEIEGDTYFASGSPGEQVNSALHQCLYDLMSQAAVDVKAVLRK
jgi:hypothetical protein